MLLWRVVVSTISIGLMVLGAAVVYGQPYPNKPIHIITGGAGGDNDFIARQIAQEITGPLGQPVVVDNRTGFLSGDAVAKAPADGYSLLVDSVSFWLAPLMQKMPYDPVKDFSPITLTSTSPYLLVVHPSVPVKSVKELIDLAKAKPGVLFYGSGPSGGGNHLAAELFKSMAGVDIVQVPYKGTPLAISALAGAEVQLAILNSASTMPHVRSGKLRGLAVTSAQPSALTPGLPTVAASGVPGYDVTSTVALFAPAKTPLAIINRLNQETVRVLNRADVKERLFNKGVEALGTSPEEFAAVIKSDLVRWGKLIKDAGIRLDSP